MSEEILKKIQRKTTQDNQMSLLETEPDWRELWWGMPDFSMADASPQHRITINFMTQEDVAEFARISGIPVTTRSDSAWFPHQKPLSGEFEWDGPKTDSRYPICIPSKGRADVQKTGKALDRKGQALLIKLKGHVEAFYR